MFFTCPLPIKYKGVKVRTSLRPGSLSVKPFGIFCSDNFCLHWNDTFTNLLFNFCHVSHKLGKLDIQINYTRNRSLGENKKYFVKRITFLCLQSKKWNSHWNLCYQRREKRLFLSLYLDLYFFYSYWTMNFPKALVRNLDIIFGAPWTGKVWIFPVLNTVADSNSVVSTCMSLAGVMVMLFTSLTEAGDPLPITRFQTEGNPAPFA